MRATFTLPAFNVVHRLLLPTHCSPCTQATFTALLLRHFGSKPQMFGKIVYGMPGDVVAHEGAAVTINGAPIGRIKPRTKTGEPLTPGAVGAIPAGCYYAGSPHPDGFDSRYAEIGFVCGRQLIGVGEPVL